MKTEVDQSAALTGVNVAIDGDHIHVRCPYNTKFILGAKRLAGNWLPKEKLWAFSVRHDELVRALCCKWFGTDGTIPPDLVEVQVAFPEARSVNAGPVTAFGRVVARASGRGGSTARLGEGVVLVEGNAFIRSDYKGWRTVISAGSVARIQGVPRSLVSSDAPPGVEVSIVEASTTPDEVSRLQVERVRLIGRLAEIDEALAKQVHPQSDDVPCQPSTN